MILTLDRAAFAIYMIVLIWSVVLFGAVHTYAYTFAFLGILNATVLVLIDNTKKNPETGTLEIKLLKTSLNPIFILILCFLFFQIIPLPEGVLKNISY